MFEIKIATLNEIPQIRDLFAKTIKESNYNDYTPAQLEAWIKRGMNDELWEKRIQNQYFIVAYFQGELTGFAALRKDGYLSHLFVDRTHQGEGLGKILIQKIEKFAQRNDMFQLIADVSITAKAFFENAGFGVVKRQTVNIGIDVDNYIMQKNI
ncbi:MAG: GNAT family N-acetyltransferase [Bacteroidales bacterium]